MVTGYGVVTRGLFYRSPLRESSQASCHHAMRAKSPSGGAAAEPIHCSTPAALQVIAQSTGALHAGEWSTSNCSVPRSWTGHTQQYYTRCYTPCDTKLFVLRMCYVHCVTNLCYTLCYFLCYTKCYVNCVTNLCYTPCYTAKNNTVLLSVLC